MCRACVCFALRHRQRWLSPRADLWSGWVPLSVDFISFLVFYCQCFDILIILFDSLYSVCTLIVRRFVFVSVRRTHIYTFKKYVQFRKWNKKHRLSFDILSGGSGPTATVRRTRFHFCPESQQFYLHQLCLSKWLLDNISPYNDCHMRVDQSFNVCYHCYRYCCIKSKVTYHWITNTFSGNKTIL